MSFALSLAADVVEVEAGATTPLGLTVVNRGEATDRFEVEIEGIDPEWRFVPVPTFSVEPGESRSEKLFLKPPRLPESVAGSYPFVVRVRSLESGEARTAQGLLKLKAFHHLTMEISPKKGVVSPTTHRNDFRLALVNLGNAEHTLQLSAQDPDDRCAYEFENDQITLGPGQQREVEMIADPKQKPVLSGSRLIGFSVVARSLNERNVSATAQAQLEQRSLLSPGTILGFILVLAVFLGWWFMRPVPPSIALSINPVRAVKGGSVQISWVAKNADHVHITVGEETVYEGPPTGEPVPWTMKESGEIQVVADATREGKSQGEDRKTVHVDEPTVVPEAKITKFWAVPTRVKLGTSFVANWSVEGATKIAITPLNNADNIPPELQKQEITPDTAGTKVYTLFAFNSEGKSVTKTLTVEVYDESEAVINDFAAKPATVKEADGGKTTLSWHVSGAEIVQLQIGSGEPEVVDGSGTRELTLTGKTQVSLIASDAKNRKVTQKISIAFEKAPVTPPATDAGATTGISTTDAGFPDKVPPLTTGTTATTGTTTTATTGP